MEDLKELFESQAAWRREKAAQYPEDKRNQEAAEILDRLAATVADIPPDVLEAYYELFDDVRDTEVEQEMLKQVGFSSAPRNAEQFVRDFIESRTSSNSIM
jgi:hypothetical protein